jgi:PKHD-type hydroxylase
MNQWWQYWKANLSKKDCEQVKNLAMSYPVKDGEIGHSANLTIKDSSIRKSKIRWLPRFSQEFYSLFGHMELLFHQSNKDAFGFDLKLFHEIQFTEYHASGEDKYDWHHDTKWVSPQPYRRKLSMCIQLSDPEDYEGGTFEFHPEDVPERPKPEELLPQGTVLIFPSFLRHRVTTVTKGTRYSLVTWYEGPNFR